MNRAQMLQTLEESSEPYDVTVIGGGATGLGVALDAANRGYRTLLLEQGDFAEATSSRSTKLIHGGVRYLRSGEVDLVRESLRERGRLLINAPEFVKPLPFVVPAYRWYERIFYGVGLMLYDLLAGKLGIERTRHLNFESTVEKVPNLSPDGLRGATLYWDGQFDDARLAVAMASAAAKEGAIVLNHVRVDSLVHDQGHVVGLIATDAINGKSFEVRSKAMINATGVFTDSVRRMDDPDAGEMMTTSQGIHLVLDEEFLGGETAVMIPKTEDGRVLFAVPWHGKVILGTTDTGGVKVGREPVAHEEEIDYLIKHMARYLVREPKRNDIRSVFAGLRPLVRRGEGGATSKLSRNHRIVVSKSGMVTITGGKWTTYREMAEEAIDRAIEVADLDPRDCGTQDLKLESRALEQEGEGVSLHERLPYTWAHVERAVNDEMAITLEDVLSRRLRALLIDAEATLEVAPEVCRKMAVKLNWSDAQITAELERFRRVAVTYRPPTSQSPSSFSSEGS
ncbi:MAG: glycerol-3-phosphate dehydrogenase/oxidase, partial [Verrucomicrobiota bacterium]